MNEKNIVIIALRLIVIYLVVQLVNLIPTWVNIIVLPFYSHFSFATWATILPLLAIIISLLIPILIWCYSSKIALLIVNKCNFETSIKINIVCSENLFIAVGLFIFAITAPEFIVWLSKYFIVVYKSNAELQYMTPSSWILITEILKLICSLILIFQPTRLLNSIKSVYK